MASNSKRRSSSSANSKTRKRVSIGTTDTQKTDSRPRQQNGRGSSSSTRKRTPQKPRSGAANRHVATKREERERRLAIQRRRRRFRVALIVTAVAAVVFGIYSIYTSQIFAVEDVEVIGAERLSRAHVLEVAAVPEGATLLRFPGAEVTRRLEEDPWIRSATVTRDFPHGVRIRIVEREPSAYVDLGEASVWLIDSTGVIIAEQSATETETLVVIRDLQPIEPQPGVKTGSEPLLNALAVWDGLSEDLKSITRVISAPSIDKTALVTTDEVEILIGAVEEIETKDVIAREILQEHGDAVVYVNVRTVERPTWRGVDQAQ